jgi:CBS domain-containing protein
MAQTVEQIMTKNPRTVNVNDTVKDAAAVMRDSDIGDVIVVEDGQVTGILTDRDIVVRAVAEHKDPSATKVSDVATHDVASLTPDQTVDDAIKIVREKNVRRIPVLDGDKPVGIVSIGDLAIERDTDSALADISSEPANN